MSLKIAIPKETAPNEGRLAVSLETVKKLTALGVNLTIEKNAGSHASLSDSTLSNAGAKITSSQDELYSNADIILCVQSPSPGAYTLLPKNSLIIGLLDPYNSPETIKSLAQNKIDSFSMELVPRISRAQSMDVLSSQSNLAGYKAVLDAASIYTRSFPMMMTAAGTVAPAKVFIMGAGVAGLQAIATAKRLGAVVSATDVRPAAKEQVASLGATFIAIEDDEFKQAETAGGYAKAMSAEYQAKQAALIAEHVAKQDIVITTALIPGRAAPRLITKEMVNSMKHGSVIVDLAVESGGNCELSKPGEIIDISGVQIMGYRNIPSRLASEATNLYAKNLFNLLNLIIDKDTKKLVINWDDEIIKGIALTKNGEIIHPNFKQGQ